MIQALKEVCSHFHFNGAVQSAKPYGMGHINDTYFVKTDAGKEYILQRMNNKVFTNIDNLMENVVNVTEYLHKKIEERSGDPERECLIIVPTDNGRSFIEDGDGFWRAYLFIRDAVTYQTAETPDLFEAAGSAFGNFQCELASFDASALHETIPDFHNTPKRYETFCAAVDADAVGNVKNALPEISFVKEHRFVASLLTDQLAAGTIPLRVTHNDTKLNNVMLDPNTHKPLAVIDLDTVMPGLSAYDFGDSIRFGATHAAEDEKDLSKVDFDMELFAAFARGFIGACGKNFSKAEILSLAAGAIVMTYECGTRFLTDYLDGKGYFKTAYADHNLVRCRTQFALVAQMLDRRDEMAHLVLTLAGQD